jgi:hypothetical protein
MPDGDHNHIGGYSGKIRHLPVLALRRALPMPEFGDFPPDPANRVLDYYHTASEAALLEQNLPEEQSAVRQLSNPLLVQPYPEKQPTELRLPKLHFW